MSTLHEIETSTYSHLGFDPYVRWLEIAENGRPLNAYQLLDVALFESNSERLRGGFHRQIQKLKQLGSGSGDASQSIQRELEDAIATLTDRDRRSLYDASVRRSLNSRPAPPEGQGDRAVDCLCGNRVAAGSAFCAGCGNSVWKLCPGCQQSNATSERFCSQCGCDIEVRENELIIAAQARLDEAKQSAKKGQFGLAIQQLFAIALQDDDRISAIADEAFRLRIPLIQRQQELTDEAAERLERASTLLDSGDHVGAVAELDVVRDEFRTPDIQTLYQRAIGRLDQIETLETSIQEHLLAKRFPDLCRDLEQLHVYLPGHEKCQRLALDLRTRLTQLAKKKATTGNHDVALTVHRSVPSFVRDAAWEKNEKAMRAQQMSHREFNATQLITKATLGLAQRIVESLPGDEAAAQRLAAMIGHAKNNGMLSVFPPSRKGGRSIRFLRAEDCVAPAKSTIELLAQRPGRFLIAIGAAMSHFEELAQGTNLAPQKKRWSVFQRKPSVEVVGLDIGQTSAKWVHLRRGKDQLELVDCRFTELHSATVEERYVEAVTAFAEFAASRKNVPVAVSVPPSMTMIRAIQVPAHLDAQPLAKAMELEYRQQLPIDMSEVYWNYSRVVTDSSNPTATVYLGAIRQSHAHAYIDELKKHKIGVDYILDEAWALGTAVRAATKAAKYPWIAMHCGATVSHLVYSSRDGIATRTVPFSSRAINDQLAPRFKLTQDQADRLRREPTRAKDVGSVLSQMDIAYVGLTRDIKRSLEMWEREFHEDVRFQHCFLSGGCALTVGLVGRVANTLGLEE